MQFTIPPDDQSSSIIRPLSYETSPFTSETYSMSYTLTIELWAVERLSPYRSTLRKHDRDVEQMIAVMHKYGFNIRLLGSPDKALIDGHLRLKAAQNVGFTEVPIIVCDNWTPEQIQAFRVLANRFATWAEGDLDMLAYELAELNLKAFDLSLTGFDPQELDELFEEVRTKRVSALETEVCIDGEA